MSGGSEEIVSVVVEGTRYTSWTRVQIRASMIEAARSFRVEVAAEAGAEITARDLSAGTKVEVYANDDRLLVGHIDSYEAHLEAREAEIAIAGRSISADVVDTSAVHGTGRFKDKTVAEIADELLRPLGLKINPAKGLKKIPRYQLDPGASVFRELGRILRSEGKSLMGEADGSLSVVDAKDAKRHAGGIFEGQNLLRGSASHDWSNRHSHYIVRGQNTYGHGPEALEIEAIAKDAEVKRYRPIIIIHELESSTQTAKERARHRRDRAAGASLRADIQVQGFRDQGGQVWTPGRLIWVESPFLDLAQDMLIETVSLTQDRSGSIASLSLVDPRAHGGKKSKGNKSGQVWDQSEDPAEATVDGAEP